MLAMRVAKRAVYPFHARIVERQGLRSGKRDAPVALEGLGDHGTLRFADDELMEAGIHFRVSGLVALFDITFVQDAVALVQTAAQLLYQARRGTPFGDAPDGHPLDQ